MQIHAEHNDSINKDEWLSLLEKYVPLNLFARVGVCERELETEQNCNILTPHSYFSFSRGAQPGWGWGPLRCNAVLSTASCH